MINQASLNPFLMFEGKAEQAMDLYAAHVPDAQTLWVKRYGDEMGEFAGKILQARMNLAGQEVIFFDSSMPHEFTFTPSVSLFLQVEDEATFDKVVEGLSEGGNFMMPVGDYGFGPKFCWFNDQFGVSWQVNLGAPQI